MHSFLITCFIIYVSAVFSTEPLKSIPLDCSFFTTDKLGNIYTVIRKNAINKYDKNGTLLYQFSIKKYGNIDYIDANNPLKLLIFFKEFNTVITLDNTLSETGLYFLPEKDIIRTGAIGLSFDNNIWLYDELAFKIIKVDDQLETLLTSNNLSAVINPDLQATFMLERNKWVYLNDPNLGIFVFDVFGSYKKKIPISGLKNFQVANDQLIYIDSSGSIFSHHLKTFDKKRIDIPLTHKPIQVRVEKGMLYILREKGLDLYPLKDDYSAR